LSLPGAHLAAEAPPACSFGLIDCVCVIGKVIYWCIQYIGVNSGAKRGSRTELLLGVKVLVETNGPSRPQLVILATFLGLGSLIGALALVLFFLFNRTIWPQQGVHIIDHENRTTSATTLISQVPPHLVSFKPPGTAGGCFSPVRILPAKRTGSGDKNNTPFQLPELALALSL
jgi:hypothetical protein